VKRSIVSYLFVIIKIRVYSVLNGDVFGVFEVEMGDDVVASDLCSPPS
jgi:hypothetical protein